MFSVNGVVVTCNPSKVELGVRFPLDAHFLLYSLYPARSYQPKNVFNFYNIIIVYIFFLLYIYYIYIKSI